MCTEVSPVKDVVGILIIVTTHLLSSMMLCGCRMTCSELSPVRDTVSNPVIVLVTIVVATALSLPAALC
jgi:hypothetical protein